MTVRTDTPYFRLYTTAKALAWDPAAVDCSRDADDWARIRREHAAEGYAEQLHRLCSLFYQGEESVARTLAPFLGAVGRLGLGVDREMFLASQLFEEAKHHEFFARYFRDVLGETRAETARHMADAPRAVLVDDLDEVTERLAAERDPARLRPLLLEAVVHYMGVVEAMLARTGYEGAHEALGARGWLPGLQEGFRLIRRDEGRHVAFGLRMVEELTRDDPAMRAVVHATFERHLPNVLATVRLFDEPHPLVDVERLQAFALAAYERFAVAAGLADGRLDDDAEEALA